MVVNSNASTIVVIDISMPAMEMKVAISWEGQDPKQSRRFTYSGLLKEVSLFANALKSLGVKKGEIACLNMHNAIPELV